MKNIIIIIISVFTFSVVQGQEKKGGVIETKFQVKGVCGECKERIESAAMRTKGVKTADWDKVTQDLTVVYNSKKVEEKARHEAVAAYGHETTLTPADSSAYTQLPACCRYKDGAKCKD
jgi:cation transport ATPase